MSTLVVCDIDGVLADCEHRLHYKDEKDYDSFYGIAMADDTKIESGINLLSAIYHGLSDYRFVYLTGRPERTRNITDLWLRGAFCPYGELVMRADGDHRKSEIVKPEIFANWLAEQRKIGREWDEIFYIDDDMKNVVAFHEAFPDATVLTFGTNRFNI